MGPMGNFFDTLRPGSLVSIRQLQEINSALRKAALMKASPEGVGYPTQGQYSLGGLAPLVPQSIERTLRSATFRDDHIRFWKTLSKTRAESTLHEATVRQAFGSAMLDPFIAEGAVGPAEEVSYERQVVRVRFLSEYFEISDVSTTVGLIGSSSGMFNDMLARRTMDATMNILRKLEMSLLYWSDSSWSPLHFDSLFKQVTTNPFTPYHVQDARGKLFTPENIEDVLGFLYGVPNYAKPNAIYCTPRVKAALAKYAMQYGRHDMVQRGARQLSFGAMDISVDGPTGPVPVIALPFLENPAAQPSATPLGGGPPNLGSNTGTGSNTIIGVPTVAADTNSKFGSSDTGWYRYWFVPVGPQGVGTPVEAVDSATSDVAVNVANAGDAVSFTIADSGLSGDLSANGALHYWRVYRAGPFTSQNDAEDASVKPETHGQWIATVGRPQSDGTINTALNTTFKDLNETLPETSLMFIGEFSPEVLQWVQLLDFTRRPIFRDRTTTIPIALLLFGALQVWIPRRIVAVRNVGLSV